LRAVRERAERGVGEIEALFREVRLAVDEREALLLREVRAAMEREQEAMAEERGRRQAAIRRLQVFQLEARKSEVEQEIQTLQRAKERTQMAQEAL